jgi:hypothetical protein
MSAPARLLLIHGLSTLRATSEAEAVGSLDAAEAQLPRTVLALDTRAHEASIHSGYWPPVEAQLRTFAAQVLAHLGDGAPTITRYVGIDEVPTLVALGAFLGDEHRLECQDYDRDLDRFAWPAQEASVEWEPIGVPREVMPKSGPVVLRIAASATIHDALVDGVLARDERIADITLQPRDATPQPTLLRAQADVDALRRQLREVLAELDRTRPGTETIHLFVAAPVPACLGVGQELRLRNGRRVQTYRYRGHPSPAQTPAIALTPEAGAAVQLPLTDAERVQAEQVRELWRQALGQVVGHTHAVRDGGPWPEYLLPALSNAHPCPVPLAPIWALVDESHAIEASDVAEFRFDRTTRTWLLSDRMLLAMGADAGADAERVRRLARAFLWHEYLHEYQLVTEHTSAGVGGFANCLERIDYVADAYGTLHQVDYLLRNQAENPTDVQVRDCIIASISEAIDAFWTFEPRPPVTTWQARRLRRYLNWYWRREQIRQCTRAIDAIALLCEPPVIEVVGPTVFTDSQRVLLNLGRVHPERLEIALIDSTHRLRRIAPSPTLSITGLLDAFRDHDRAGIDRFFASLIDHVRPLA